MPRTLLTDAQRTVLFDHPTADLDLVRHYTLAMLTAVALELGETLTASRANSLWLQ